MQLKSEVFSSVQVSICICIGLPASESREKKEIGSTGKNHGENGVEIIISEKFLLAHHIT